MPNTLKLTAQIKPSGLLVKKYLSGTKIITKERLDNMSARILLTMREDEISSYSERRDGIDKRWYELMLQADLLPILVPNSPEIVEQMLRNETFDGLLLTGGNTLGRYGGDAPERDKIETLLLRAALSRNKPILGVCRGMQQILDFYGAPLTTISGHVATQHTLICGEDGRLSDYIQQYKTANSFHNLGVFECPSFKKMATSEDGNIEAIEHPSKPIFGIMWHPEREPGDNQIHIEFLKRVFISHDN